MYAIDWLMIEEINGLGSVKWLIFFIVIGSENIWLFRILLSSILQQQSIRTVDLTVRIL